MKLKLNENTSVRVKVFFLYLPLQLILLMSFGMLVSFIYQALTDQWLQEELSLKAKYASAAVDDMMLSACSVINRSYIDVNPSAFTKGGSLLDRVVSEEELSPVETFELYSDVLDPYFAAHYEPGKRMLRLYLPDGYVMYDGRYVMPMRLFVGKDTWLTCDTAKIQWNVDKKTQTISLYRVLMTDEKARIGVLSYEIHFSVVTRLLTSYLDPDGIDFAYDLTGDNGSARVVDRAAGGTNGMRAYASLYQQGRLYAAYRAMPFRAVDKQLTRILWLLIGVALMLSALLSYLFSRMITGRLFKLMKRIRLLKGGVNKESALTGTDEAAKLDRYITELVDELELRSRRENRILLENKNLEIQMLQLQFKPHFLYNTLSAIRWSVLKTDNRMVAHVIEDMIAMYRMTLNDGQSLITVEKEIEIVRCYLDITAFAYDTPYQLTVRVDPEMSKLTMPKCVLQPLVENAVKYAYEPSDTLRRISLSGRAEGGLLSFEVRDYGKGFSPAVLAWACGEAGVPEGAGLGLRNLRARMRSIFAGSARFTILNAEDGGAIIRLCFPAIRLEKESRAIAYENPAGFP